MASDIGVTLFSAVAAIGMVTLGAMAAPPAGFEDLSYMQPAKLRFFRNASNNAATATQIGESTSGVLTYETTATYFYFAAAVDPVGNEGPRTAGIQCVPKTAQPPANSVGTTELKNGAVTNQKIDDLAVSEAKIANAAISNAKIANLAVDNAKIANMAASKLTAGTITASISITSPTINGGTITGANLQTASTGSRVMVRGAGSNNDIVVYNGSNSIICAIGDLLGPTGAFGGWTSLPTLSVSNQSTGYSIDAWKGKVRAVDGYLPFTGMHQMLVRKDAELADGDLAASLRIVARDRWSNVLAEVERSSTVGDRRIVGVVSERRAMLASDWLPGLGTRPRETREVERVPPVRRRIMERYDLVTLNALGEGQMLVCGRGGDIEAGDYVCSSDMAGKGQRQNDAAGEADDLLRRCTVAQTMEPVTFDHPDQVRRVAVFYRCG